MTKRVFTLFAMILFIASAFTAWAGGQDEGTTTPSDVDFTDNPYTDGQDLSGTTVNIFGAFVDEDARRFELSMIPFEEATGIDIVYEGSGDFETLITVRVEGGSPPDIAAFPQPGIASDLIASIEDMEEWFGMDYLSQQYNDAWLELADIGGKQAGLWFRANVKSLVWYNLPVFEAQGYEIPTTWDELIALSDQMVADGFTPWTIGIESSGATGWTATDWIEDIMLRIHPPEVYDAWVAGELPFNSPEVREAVDIMAEIWFNEDYVLGGRDGIVLTPFGDAPTPMITPEPPAALMHRQASFIPAFFPNEGREVGTEVGFFYLPPIDESLGRPVLGAGDLYSAFRDRPEVRAVMSYLSTGFSTRGWIEEGGFISPHRDADFDWYPSVIDRGIAEILQEATTFRFDASDLMPGAVGAGTFWTAMTEFVNNENANLDALLDEIDASWPN